MILLLISTYWMFLYPVIGAVIALLVYWLDVRRALGDGFNEADIKQWLYSTEDRYWDENNHVHMKPKRMDMNQLIFQQLVCDLLSYECTHNLYKYFKLDYEKNTIGMHQIPSAEGLPADGSAMGGFISIEELSSMLLECNKRGATHLVIEYHVDHDEYMVSGYKLRIPTQLELQQMEIDPNPVTDWYRKEIAETEKKLADLKKSLKELQKYWSTP